MFKRLKQYRLKERPYSFYARRQMDKEAKKAGFIFAAKHGGAYYVEDMKRDNIRGDALRVIHYLHDNCARVGQFNETLCVALFPDGEIISTVHLVGNCALCDYHWIYSSAAALHAKDMREGTNRCSRRHRTIGW